MSHEKGTYRKGLWSWFSYKDCPADCEQLKCSGNREGCANCAANDVECIYPQPNRTSNGTAKRSRPAAHATRPRAVTQPGASKLSASSRTPDPQPPTPPLTTSASTTPLDSGITSNPWGADLALASGDISGFLESFWTESPTSLEDRFEDNAESFLPDLGSDAFQCHESLSTSE